MAKDYDHGYGSLWQELLVYRREGYTTSVADYHKHEYYELNLILSGNVRILLPDHSVETDRSHIILTAPGTPHYISCEPDRLYSRLYLCFSEAFVQDFLPQWQQLRGLFGENGAVVAISPDGRELCRQIIERLEAEEDPLRQRLLIYLLLSHVAEFAREGAVAAAPTPYYIIEALSHIREHYARKLVAEELAQTLHVGRTTLMTAFKKHTGSTVDEFLTACRLRHAIQLLEVGKTLEYAADQCGYADTGGLIRAFRRCYGMTPKEYMKK
jgi:AraC-like DNA-binding protein